MSEPRCPACGSLVDVSEHDRNKPAMLYEACWRCRLWSKFLLFFTAFVFLAVCAFEVLAFKVGGLDLGRLVSSIGLSLDIWGAFFLAVGYTERIMVWIGSLGAHDAVRVYLPRQTWRVRIGVILLVLGFVGQSLGQYIGST